MSIIEINTSNPHKQQEYQEYIGKTHTLVWQHRDLEEPDADTVRVVQYKASQFDRPVLVDDVCVTVDGSDIGPDIKWRVGELPDHVGSAAYFTCTLGIRSSPPPSSPQAADDETNNTNDDNNNYNKDKIFVYQATVPGKIVKAKGDGFGFGPHFLPDGATQTLGEYMDPQYNARYLALQAFLQNQPFVTLPPLPRWDGTFQQPQQPQQNVFKGRLFMAGNEYPSWEDFFSKY